MEYPESFEIGQNLAKALLGNSLGSFPRLSIVKIFIL